MKSKKFQKLKARVERLEKGPHNPEEAADLIEELRSPSKGSSQYRALLNRARSAANPKDKRVREADPWAGIRSTGPQGMTSGPELTGGTHTVSGGLSGSKR